MSTKGGGGGQKCPKIYPHGLCMALIYIIKWSTRGWGQNVQELSTCFMDVPQIGDRKFVHGWSSIYEVDLENN